jgi:hypothetical protein
MSLATASTVQTVNDLRKREEGQRNEKEEKKRGNGRKWKKEE